jgi:hypothetical protein
MYLLEQPALLSTAYLGPVRYFSKFILHKSVCIEAHENYSKQSFRNRCTILSANGPFSLSIPVKYSNNPKSSIQEVLLDYATPWNKIHWQAIISAYRNSPFFEYFVDDLQPYYTRRFSLLFDYNRELTGLLLRMMGLEPIIQLTTGWEPAPDGMMDYRDSIHPKRSRNAEDIHYGNGVYLQVFHSKFGFVPDLSIIDLLFNTGPEAASILEGSLR